MLAETADFVRVEETRRGCTALGVKVLVTVSPIPEGDIQQATYKTDLAGHPNGGVSTLPDSFFTIVTVTLPGKAPYSSQHRSQSRSWYWSHKPQSSMETLSGGSNA
jgi:hypothetical protein